MVSIYDDLPELPEGGLLGLVKKGKKDNTRDQGRNIVREAVQDWRDKKIARRKRKKYKFKAQLKQRANR